MLSSTIHHRHPSCHVSLTPSPVWLPPRLSLRSQRGPGPPYRSPALDGRCPHLSVQKKKNPPRTQGRPDLLHQSCSDKRLMSQSFEQQTGSWLQTLPLSACLSSGKVSGSCWVFSLSACIRNVLAEACLGEVIKQCTWSLVYFSQMHVVVGHVATVMKALRWRCITRHRRRDIRDFWFGCQTRCILEVRCLEIRPSQQTANTQCSVWKLWYRPSAKQHNLTERSQKSLWNEMIPFYLTQAYAWLWGYQKLLTWICIFRAKLLFLCLFFCFLPCALGFIPVS